MLIKIKQTQNIFLLNSVNLPYVLIHITFYFTADLVQSNQTEFKENMFYLTASSGSLQTSCIQTELKSNRPRSIWMQVYFTASLVHSNRTEVKENMFYLTASSGSLQTLCIQTELKSKRTCSIWLQVRVHCKPRAFKPNWSQREHVNQREHVLSDCSSTSLQDSCTQTELLWNRTPLYNLFIFEKQLGKVVWTKLNFQPSAFKPNWSQIEHVLSDCKFGFTANLVHSNRTEVK